MERPKRRPSPRPASIASPRWARQITTREAPCRARRSITWARKGRPATGTMPFGSPPAASPRRVPRPPARIATGGRPPATRSARGALARRRRALLELGHRPLEALEGVDDEERAPLDLVVDAPHVLADDPKAQ